MDLQLNAEGTCFTYYGTYNVNDRPRLGVEYFMLDEHVKKTIDKQKEKFSKEMSKMMLDFNKAIKKLMEKQEEEIKKIHSSIGEMTRFMCRIVEVNELKQPEIEKKKVVKKKKVKAVKEEEEDEGDMGYL